MQQNGWISLETVNKYGAGLTEEILECLVACEGGGRKVRFDGGKCDETGKPYLRLTQPQKTNRKGGKRGGKC